MSQKKRGQFTSSRRVAFVAHCELLHWLFLPMLNTLLLCLCTTRSWIHSPSLSFSFKENPGFINVFNGGVRQGSPHYTPHFFKERTIQQLPWLCFRVSTSKRDEAWKVSSLLLHKHDARQVLTFCTSSKSDVDIPFVLHISTYSFNNFPIRSTT